MTQARRYAGRLILGLALSFTAATGRAGAQTPEVVARTPDVIFVVSPPRVVEAMLRVAQVTGRDTVYDLGSGDGRVVIMAAQRFRARGVGIDLDPELIRKARANADTAGVTGRVEFRQEDLFETDLRSATVVALYLSEELNAKLRPKLFGELRPGTRVVSHEFGMGDWQPDSVVRIESDYSNVYYWMFPARAGGTWRVNAPGAGGRDRRYTLRLVQRYQRISGSASIGGRTLPVTGGQLVGERITFNFTDTIGDRPVTMRFSGRVSGNTMSGTVTRGAAKGRAWRADRVPS
jgi:SAM-dependent methyltransferase